MSKFLISVVGPTAIGKTSLAIALATHYKTEIISSDSRQFYKEMCIGTAVPSQEELNAAKHHFIQHISIHDTYNVGAFEKDAINKLNQLFTKHEIIIMVGGSGLYNKAVIDGFDDFPDVDSNIRLQLNEELSQKGLAHLQDRLLKLDKTSYESLAIDNPHRVIRALEICIGTGKPFSSFLGKKKTERNFDTITIGLQAERTLLYDRINKRVDLMLNQGLVEEAKSLYNYAQLNALNTVGYKELFAHFNGDISLEKAIEEIKKNTRRFAKRQLTWFRKDDHINWFDYSSTIEPIVSFIDLEIKKINLN